MRAGNEGKNVSSGPEPKTSQSTCSSEKNDEASLGSTSDASSNLDKNTRLSTETSDCAMETAVKSAILKRQKILLLRRLIRSLVYYLNRMVKKFEEKDISIEIIAKILARNRCKLSNVICLKNVELTRAFLIKKDSMSDDNHLEDDRDDSLATVDQVMASVPKQVDLQNIEVLLKYGRDKNIRIKQFFNNLASMSTNRRNVDSLKSFVEKIIEWDILNKKASKLIELEVFQKAPMPVVQVFIECKIHASIEQLFHRNALTALFGNANVTIGYLKQLQLHLIDAQGNEGFTALHYAAKNSLIDKVKFLLDNGAEPNLLNWKMQTPLILTLREPQVYSIHNKNIAELLLQHDANPFWFAWFGSLEQQSFNSFLHFNYVSSEDNNASLKCLMELALAYCCIKKSMFGNSSIDNAVAFVGIHASAVQNVHLFNFFRTCLQQLRLLTMDNIRANVTMFTILSEPGCTLIRRIHDEVDRRTITSFINQYSIGKTLHPYYINALKEHMRQYRMLLRRQNKAALILSECTRKPVKYKKILDKVHSCLTSKDLLMFQ